MKKGLRIFIIMMMAIALSACGTVKEEKTKAESGSVDQKETTTDQKIDNEGEVKETTSLLTGCLVSEKVKNNRPLAVMFNNIKEGCPQTGISLADIVYEAPVEGRITRLMGIFEDYQRLETIGSIRSSRDYFVYFAMEYDALYAHFGQATPYVGDLLNSDRVDNISGQVAGIDRPSIKSFFRSEDRKAPHNVYITTEGLLQDIERFNYRTTKKEEGKAKFRFASEETPYTFLYAEDATKIYPGGKENTKSNGFSKVEAFFDYDEKEEVYHRYQYGAPHIDELTGEQLSYSNVIFQYCHGEVRDNEDYLAFGCHGDEDRMVRVFTQGKMIPGVWSRTSDEEPAMYIDYEGNPITLSPGKTWICIIWDEYRDDVVFE